MSDYFQHWLALGRKLEGLCERAGTRLPKIYCVNWFRKGADGKFVWPGYGENMRVLRWMLERVQGRAGGAENAFGISPRYEDLDWQGLAFSPAQFDSVIGIDCAAWQKELHLHQELFEQLAHRLPAELPAAKARLAQRLA
jgi:phosphoenolpyruvate carboxykinase (GTP)